MAGNQPRAVRSVTVRLKLKKTTGNDKVCYREVLGEKRVQPLIFDKTLYVPQPLLSQETGEEAPGRLDVTVTALSGVIDEELLPCVLMRDRITANFGAYACAIPNSLFWRLLYIPKTSLEPPFGEIPYRLLLKFSIPGDE